MKRARSPKEIAADLQSTISTEKKLKWKKWIACVAELSGELPSSVEMTLRAANEICSAEHDFDCIISSEASNLHANWNLWSPHPRGGK